MDLGHNTYCFSFSAAEHDWPKKCKVCGDAYRCQRHSSVCVRRPRWPWDVYAHHERWAKAQSQCCQGPTSACVILSTQLPHSENKVGAFEYIVWCFNTFLMKLMYLSYVPCIKKFGLLSSASFPSQQKGWWQRVLFFGIGLKGVHISFFKLRMLFTLTKSLEKSSSHDQDFWFSVRRGLICMSYRGRLSSQSSVGCFLWQNHLSVHMCVNFSRLSFVFDLCELQRQISVMKHVHLASQSSACCFYGKILTIYHCTCVFHSSEIYE